MKSIHIGLFLVVAFADRIVANAQGTFQNLDFESADLTSIPSGQYGGYVPITSALPYWTGYLGGVQTMQVSQNDFSLGAASIDIFGPQWTGSPGIIDGNYTVFLQPGGSVNFIDASITQTGTIPTGTETILFKAWQPPYAVPFSVSFAGNILSPVTVSSGQSPSGQDYNVYAADVSAFAGQAGQLAFTVTGNNYNSLLLDDIMFSPTPLSEPSPLALAGVGGLLFALYRRVSPKPAKSGRSAKTSDKHGL